MSAKPLTRRSCRAISGYRYYSPTTGRWLSRDPLEEEGGLNLYGFCINDPLSFTDSYGTTPEQELEEILSNHKQWPQISEASNVPEAVGILHDTLSKVKVITGDPKQGARGTYHNKIIIRDNNDPYNLAHELVHAYDDINLNLDHWKTRRIDEGMAYATDKLLGRAIPAVGRLEANLVKYGCPKRSEMQRHWQNLWRDFSWPGARGWKGAQWKGFGWPDNGNGIDLRASWLEHEFLLNSQDFQNVKNNFKLHMSCKEIAKIINELLMKNGCGCYYVTCNLIAGGEMAIPAGHAIDPAFE